MFMLLTQILSDQILLKNLFQTLFVCYIFLNWRIYVRAGLLYSTAVLPDVLPGSYNGGEAAVP